MIFYITIFYLILLDNYMFFIIFDMTIFYVIC